MNASSSSALTNFPSLSPVCATDCDARCDLLGAGAGADDLVGAGADGLLGSGADGADWGFSGRPKKSLVGASVDEGDFGVKSRPNQSFVGGACSGPDAGGSGMRLRPNQSFVGVPISCNCLNVRLYGVTVPSLCCSNTCSPVSQVRSSPSPARFTTQRDLFLSESMTAFVTSVERNPDD